MSSRIERAGRLPRLAFAIGLGLAIAGCGAAPPATSPTAPSVEGSASSSDAPGAVDPGASLDPVLARSAIAYAIAQRRLFGLRADVDWVEQVAADPRATMDPLDFLMLPEEAAEFYQHQADFEAVGQAVQAYGEAHASEFGGVWIDQERHTVVSAWTANAELHRIAILAALGKAGPLEVRVVRYSEAELRALQDRLSADLDWFAGIDAMMTSTSVDVMTNRAELSISSANPQATALIFQRYGVAPDKLRVISDGTGILLQPRGTVHGRVVLPDGKAPGRNDWMLNWVPDRPGGDCGEMVGYGVEPDGAFELPCAPGGWTIAVQAPVNDGWLDIGTSHVLVPAGGDVDLAITVDPGLVPSP